MHRAHTRVCVHTFDSVYPKYTLEAFGMHYIFESVRPMRTYTRIHPSVHNL